MTRYGATVTSSAVAGNVRIKAGAQLILMTEMRRIVPFRNRVDLEHRQSA